MATVAKKMSLVADASERMPTDISAKGVADIARALNGLVADAFALYVKTKNFHWHMTGPNFRDYHLLLDEQAAQIYASIDPIAERVRKVGGKTVTSIGNIAKLQSIKDNDQGHISPKDMLVELMEDNKKMLAAMREAHSVCDDHGDLGTTSELEVYIDQTERRTWFLFETSRAAGKGAH